MPLPLVPIILGAITAAQVASTAKSVYKTVDNLIEASEIVDKAKELLQKAKTDYNNSLDYYNRTIRKLLTLGESAISTLKSYSDQISYDEYIRKASILYKEELEKALRYTDISEEHRVELLNEVDCFRTLSKSFCFAISTSKFANMSIVEIAKMIGKASTGRAISGLSGIAQRNAIYAWLGGGAKAAGGLGMQAGQFLTSAASFTGGIAIVAFGAELLSMKALNNSKQEAEKLTLEASDFDIKARLINKESSCKNNIYEHLNRYYYQALSLINQNKGGALRILSAVIVNINHVVNEKFIAIYGEELSERIKRAIDEVVVRLRGGY